MRTLAFLLSLLLVFAIPFEDTVIIGDFGTLTRGIGVLAAVVWLSSALVGREFRKLRLFHMVMFLFIMWNIASLFWSVDIDATILRIKTYVQLGILAWLLWNLYTTPKTVRAALQAYVLGAYVSIGSTFINFLAGQEIGGRYAATGFNLNDLGLILALGIPIAWHLAVSQRNGGKARWLRLVNYAYIPAAIVTIQLTASRGSLLAAVPSFLFILMSLRRFRPLQRLLILLAIVLAIFAVQPMIPQFNIQRLSTTFDSIAKGDLSGRENTWATAISVFAGNQILGIGSGSLSFSAHNSFFSVLAETGAIGFFLFAVIVTIAIYEALRQPKWHAWLWLTILAVWTIGAFVHTWEQKKPTWLFLNLVVISASLFRNRDRVAVGPALSVEPTVQSNQKNL